MARMQLRSSRQIAGREELAEAISTKEHESPPKTLNTSRMARKRTNKTKDRLGGEEGMEAVGTSEVAEPLPPLNPWIKFRKEYQRTVSSKGVKVTEYNAIARAAYNKLSEEDVRKRKAEYLKEKEEYVKEMARLGKPIVQKSRVQVKNQKYTIRCSPKQMVSLVSRIDEVKKQQIRDIGFGGLLDIQCQLIPNGIATWLVNNFNPTLSSFNLHGGGVLPLTAKDIGLILGIPNEGPVPIEDADTSEVGGAGPSRRTYKWKELPNELVAMNAGDEFKRLFVTFACGCLLAPSTRAEHKIRLWDCIQFVDKLATFNWAEYVRNVLCNKVLEVQKKSQQQHQYVGGCIFVLLIHYLDRVVILKHKVSRTIPRAKAWTDALISERDALEIKNLGGYGKGKLVGTYESLDDETGVWTTEFPADLLGMMMDSGHADVGAELCELYNIAVSSQRRILKIAEMISSHPRAKATSSDVEALDKGKEPIHETDTMQQQLDNEEESAYQSAEDEKVDDEDEEEDESDAEHDERRNTISDVDKAEVTTADNNNVSGQQEGQDRSNSKWFGHNKEQDVQDKGDTSGAMMTTSDEGRNDHDQQQDQHNLNVTEYDGEGLRTGQQPSIAVTFDDEPHGTHTPRRLRSYGRKRKGGPEIEIKQRPARVTKKSTILSSAEYILPVHVTVSLYEKNVAAYAWHSSKNPKDVLIQMFQLSLTRLDLKTLVNDMHVSNRVIDMFARLLNWGAKTATNTKTSRYIVEPIAVDGILKMPKFDSLSNASLSAKLKKLFKVRSSEAGVDPAICQLILIPVCIETHWFMYSFDVSHRVVHLLDPNSDQAKSKDISVLNRLKRALGVVMATKFGQEIDFTGFGFELVDVPHHSPDKVCDSGVFSMIFLDHWNGRLAVRITEENVAKYRVLYTARLCTSAENSKFQDSFAEVELPKRARLNVGDA